ncbi:hypothetical protein [Chondromyces apiculatus]|uniref:Lipoprotein n=1 Tax=Chondromyces apiculatus DSM 436 TaxID=1192034 RepID=A0A017TC07_9BACT|nr:hypothetical protein [Chondromyces apiculatus]EYF06126.1 Hypothetical protein CAP_2316 [Chondromyces apiculatus DSM 436]
MNACASLRASLPLFLVLAACGGEEAPASDQAADAACCATVEWVQRVGSYFTDHGASVVTDAEGNAILAGLTSEAVTAGDGTVTTGSYVPLFVKLDTSGHPLWSRSFPEARAKLERLRIDDEGRLTLAGAAREILDFGDGPHPPIGESDVFVARFDANGLILWSRRLGGDARINLFDVAVDHMGHTILVGSFEGTIDLGRGSLTSVGSLVGAHDGLVVKLDPEGNTLWSVSFGGPGNDGATAVAVDDASNLLVAGSIDDATTADRSAPVDSNTRDALLMKLDPDGAMQWRRTFGGPGLDTLQELAIDAQGDLSALGLFTQEDPLGTPLFVGDHGMLSMVVRFDPSGIPRWAHDFGGIPQDLAVDAEGNSIAVGYRFTRAGREMVVARHDGDGALEWQLSNGQVWEAIATGVAFDHAGNAFLTGSFTGNLELGDHTLTSAGFSDTVASSSDIYVARLLP